MICASYDNALTDGGPGAKASAFTVSITNAGIHGLGTVVQCHHHNFFMIIWKLVPVYLEQISLLRRKRIRRLPKKSTKGGGLPG